MSRSPEATRDGCATMWKIALGVLALVGIVVAFTLAVDAYALHGRRWGRCRSRLQGLGLGPAATKRA